MSTLRLTIAARTAMLSNTGLLARLDTGGVASIDIYDTLEPADEEDADAVVDTPLVTIVLTTPCGNISPDAVVSLTQDDSTGDMIAVSGSATWGMLRAGDGVAMGVGPVTAAAGAGPFRINGSTGTDLFMGARAKLGTVAIA